MKIKAVGYVRVSTQRQVSQGFSLLSQSQRIAGTAQERGWDLKLFQDEGVSGYHIANRSGLRSLLQEIKTDNQIRYLVVAKLDRLSRNSKELLQLVDFFQEKRIRLISLTEQLDDLTTPVGTAQIQIHGAVAEFERSIIKENVQLSLARKFQQGQVISPQLPYGYFFDKQRRIQIEVASAEIVKFLYKAYLEGKGYRKLSTLVREKYRVNLRPVRVKKILMNQHYTGIAESNYGKHNGIYPPIIGQSVFVDVQTLMTKKRLVYRKKISKKEMELLKSKIVCPICRHNMSSNRVCISGKVYRYYYCSVGTNYPRQDGAYHSFRLRSTDIEEAVKKVVSAVFKSRVFQDFFIEAVVRQFSTKRKMKGYGNHVINHKQIFRQFENGELTVEQLREQLVIASDGSALKNGQRKMKLSQWLEKFSKLERTGFIDLIVSTVIVDQEKKVKSILLGEREFDFVQLQEELL